MIGKLVSRSLAVGALVASIAGQTLAVSVTVDSVEALNPNPNALTMVDAASNSSTPNGVTLATFQSLMMGAGGAYQRNLGGVLNFEQTWQGGSWPEATQSNNGIDVGNGAANLVTARYGVGLAKSVRFYRTSTGTDAIDSNTNNIVNAVSSTVSGQGGGPNQTAGGVSKWNFTTHMYDPPASATPDVGGGYMGIVGGAAVELNFLNGLRAFGITGLPRGATRTSQFTFTLSDNSTFSTTNETVGTSAVFFGAQLTPAQLSGGLYITKVAIIHGAAGVNRYDDLAFIPIPEPTSASLLMLAGIAGGVIRRRRR